MYEEVGVGCGSGPDRCIIAAQLSEKHSFPFYSMKQVSRARVEVSMGVR